MEVSTEAEPKAGDDAKVAHFYNLKDIMADKTKLAFDHHDILKEMIDKKLKNIYI